MGEHEGPSCPLGYSTGLDTQACQAMAQVLGVGDKTTDCPTELSLLLPHLIP